MSKRKKVNRKQKQEYSEEFNIDSKKVFKIILAIVLTLGVFYLLTLGILSKKESVIKKYNTSIQYKKILVGESFTQKKKEYYVLYYNSGKDNMDEIHSLIAEYGAKKEKIYLYTVDMNEAFNKSYVSDESNTNAQTAEELKISGVTLIHFKDGKIVEYVTDGIDKYLK